MARLLLLMLATLLGLPSAASAATVNADVERRHGTTFGVVTFTAARGEVNDVTVTEPAGQLRFHDDANRVRARGECDQVNRSTAVCPLTEDNPKVKLGDRDDRARVAGLATILGGSGDDRLRGSAGFNSLDGQGGDDTLRGRGNGDDLTGGPGRDRLLGGGGDDDLIDGETDGNAARDIYRGGSSRDTAGSDRGDLISYSTRKRALEIRLSQRRRTPDGDVLGNLESVTGGSGNDRIVGDPDDNWLTGGGGNDFLQARHGADNVNGGAGNDKLAGGPDADLLSGGAGKDWFNSHGGDDFVVANDSFAERVTCNLGRFDTARVTRIDKVVDCEVAAARRRLYIRVQPEVSGDIATFQVACQHSCHGTIELNGPKGQDFGSGTFTDLPDDPQTFSPVTVELTQAAVEALATGVIVQVAHGDTGGYTAFMQSG